MLRRSLLTALPFLGAIRRTKPETKLFKSLSFEDSKSILEELIREPRITYLRPLHIEKCVWDALSPGMQRVLGIAIES